MSLRPEPWDDVVARLAVEPLSALASSLQIEEFELLAWLVVDGTGQPAERTAWWPEAVRMRAAGESIRGVARRFQTDPRRVRRGLARLGLRVGGVDVPEGEGAEVLAAVRDRVGMEPDTVVAKAVGVAPEAIKGERRRLGIPGHVQRRRVKLTADDEAWIRGPLKVRRTRVRTEPESLQVVRRPSGRVGTEPRRADSEDGPRRLDTPRAGFAPSRPDPRRDFFRNDHQAEIDRLLEPTARRDGPRRLVRSPDSRPMGSPEPRPAAPLPGTGLRSPLRSVPPPADAVRPAAASSASRGTSPGSTPTAPSLPGLRSVPPPALVSAAPAQSFPADPDDVEWNIQVPGWTERVTVIAPDIVTALARAAERVPSALLARASIWRADGPMPGGEWNP